MNKAFDKVIKSHIGLAILSFFAVVLMAGGVSYSLFQIDKKNTTNQTVAVGTLSGELTSITGAIVVNDLYPQSASEITADGKKYSFTISNTGTYDLNYEIYLKDATDALLANTTEYSSYKRISTSHYQYINYKLDGGNAYNLITNQNGDKFVVLRGTLKAGASEDHYLQFFLDNKDTTTTGAPNDISGSVLSLDIYFDAGVTEIEPTSAEVLIAKANDASVTNYSDGNQQEMFTFDHPEATQTTGWSEKERRDYRYIGNEPNNYIDFNDETWRIIGVFTVETESGEKEQLMKIIREEFIEDQIWNYNNEAVNEWSTASLKTLLNEDYYNQTGSYTSTSTIKGLSSKARSQIANVKWYIGGSKSDSGLGGPDYYAFERGIKTCATESTYCSEGRSTNIIAKVGLMYPSDYVYTYANGVDNTCYTMGSNCINGTPANGWLLNNENQWVISPYAGDAKIVFYVSSFGNVEATFKVDPFGTVISNSDNTIDINTIRPTAYLSSDVAIVDGNGSSGNHYKLGEKTN